MSIKQDSPRGWAVVAAAFVTHFVTHAIVYSYGILFLTLEEVFKSTKAEMAWIASITTGALYLSGPIASICLRRYGCRIVSVTGAILSAFGCGLTIIAPNLYFLYFSLGLLSGVGYGLIFIPAVVEVTMHFKKQRALACGIAVSGAGAGALISPLIEYLLETYAWRGTLIICAGVLLNCIPCSLIYRSEFVVVKEEMSNTVQNIKHFEDMEINYSANTCSEKFDLVDSSTNANNELIEKPVTAKSDHHIPDADSVPIPSASDRLISNNLDENAQAHLHDEIVLSKTTNQGHVKHHCCGISNNLLCRIVQRRDMILFYSSQVLFFLGFYFPFIGIPSFGLHIGVEERKVVWIISACGISTIVGRVLLGFLSDRSFMNSFFVYKIALLVAGISTALVPSLRTYSLLIIYAVIYGSSTAVLLSQTTVVLVEIVGLEMMSDAMGLNNMFSGVGALIGPPLLGLLYDVTASYNYPFIVSGTGMTLGGLLLFLMRYCTKH